MEMRMFRPALGQMGWLIGLQPAIFFFVVGISTFMAKEDISGSAPTASDLSLGHCTPEVLKTKISYWARYLVITLLSSVFFTLCARVVVDAVADAEDKAEKAEEESYKAALSKKNQAESALYRAAKRAEDLNYGHAVSPALADALRKVSDANRMLKDATKKAASMKPKIGIARLVGWKRKCLRSCFCLGILSSLGTSVCGSVAFYFSLQIQLRCVNGPSEVTPFTCIGVLALLIHGFLFWVAVTQN